MPKEVAKRDDLAQLIGGEAEVSGANRREVEASGTNRGQVELSGANRREAGRIEGKGSEWEVIGENRR
jgi:hypothetical protein